MHLLFLTEQNGICYYLMNIKEIKGEYYEEKNYCLRFASYKINVPSDKLDGYPDFFYRHNVYDYVWFLKDAYSVLEKLFFAAAR